MREGPSCSRAQEEAAAMDAAAERIQVGKSLQPTPCSSLTHAHTRADGLLACKLRCINIAVQATIKETERTSVTRVEEMGLPEGVEDEKGLMLVRCKTCAHVLLAGSCAAHEEKCRSAPAPLRPAGSPAPTSTTASVPASSGPGSISQARPRCPACATNLYAYSESPRTISRQGAFLAERRADGGCGDQHGLLRHS